MKSRTGKSLSIPGRLTGGTLGADAAQQVMPHVGVELFRSASVAGVLAYAVELHGAVGDVMCLARRIGVQAAQLAGQKLQPVHGVRIRCCKVVRAKHVFNFRGNAQYLFGGFHGC